MKNVISQPIFEDQKDISVFDWGQLEWIASGPLNNAEQLTVGTCRLKPGHSNPVHFHPNCEEVLIVKQGIIAHTLGDGHSVILRSGDSISIPQGTPHNAKNISEQEAVLDIIFSSADRQTEVIEDSEELKTITKHTPPSHKAELTVLNTLEGENLEASLKQCLKMNLRLLDFKNNLWGQRIEELDLGKAHTLKGFIEKNKLEVSTLSSCLFADNVEIGEQAFRKKNISQLKHLLEVSQILRPTFVRLIMAGSEVTTEITNSFQFLKQSHPWIFPLYREAVDSIVGAGFIPVIENEIGNCLFRNPWEIVHFFEELNRPKCKLIWDIGNLWSKGCYPSLETYNILRPYIGMVHLKGGKSNIPGGSYDQASYLSDTSWPVIPLVREIIRDERSPVICINPPHGKRDSQFEIDYEKEIHYLRTELGEYIR